MKLVRAGMLEATLRAARAQQGSNIWKKSLCVSCVLGQQKWEWQNKEHEMNWAPPVARANLGQFFQNAPSLRNVFTQDPLMLRYLERIIPNEILPVILEDLKKFGHKVGSSISVLGQSCELNPPHLKQFDAWGNRVDSIVTCDAWKRMHDISAMEGLIAIPYEQQFGDMSRIYQAAKLFMFCASSGLYSCPLAMTDGAAKIMKELPIDDPLLKSAFNRLTSRDASSFWTSGQWMTEKRGGSDVANGTETVAVRTGENTFKLFGYKWFTSATDSEIAITLARIVDDTKSIVEGSKGLSLFYLETRKENGKLNNIEVVRLKNKLGTRQLPTAELLLDGTEARLISEVGRGVASISPMLTITRIHNSIAAVSGMRKILLLSRDYATKRFAFGNILTDYPLHMQVLAKLEVETFAAFLFTMEIFRLLGRQECGVASKSESDLLRLLTPILKLYTAKQAIAVTSEGLESFGGQGYIEDTGLPTLFRDSQVLSIWEGTTNILSLDVLRSIARSKGQVLETFVADVERKLSAKVKNENLMHSRDKLVAAHARLIKFIEIATSKSDDFFQNAARDFAFSLARIYMGSLIFDHACSAVGSERDSRILQRWCLQDLTPVISSLEAGVYESLWRKIDLDIVMAGHE